MPPSLKTEHITRRHPFRTAGLAWLVGVSTALGYTASATDQKKPVPATEPSARYEPEANLKNEQQMDDSNNGRHALIIDEAAQRFRRGQTSQVVVTTQPAGVAMAPHRLAKRGGTCRRATYTSRPIRCPFQINSVISSWNVDLPEKTGFVVYIRLRRKTSRSWTPFYYLGTWGTVPGKGIKKRIEDRHGRIAIDYFRSQRLFDRVQYKLLLFSTTSCRSPVLRRFTLALSNTRDLATGRTSRPRRRPPVPGNQCTRRLDVPFRSQQREDAEIARSVCSPVSVAMVMEYYGVRQTSRKMCDLIWDQEYKLYGNWTRAVQASFLFGVPGYLQRFGSWNTVRAYIAQEIPIIASIRAPEPGMLRGAPYRTSDGHLLVITGLDGKGNVHVNDPYGKTRRKGLCTYTRKDMQKVWLDQGGVGYVLLPAETRHASQLACSPSLY
jgi:hypothetical protein